MEKISKNLYKGDAIVYFDEIHLLATQSKSIYHINFGVKPAAIILSMQANQVYRMLKNGSLFKTIKRSEYLLERIYDYIQTEDFPAEHLQALHDIVVHFNWSDESEKEIFEFSKHIKEKYKS